MNTTQETIVNFLRAAQASGQPMVKQAQLINSEDVFSVAKLETHLTNPLLTPDWLQVVLNGAVVDLTPDFLWKNVQRRKLQFLSKTTLNNALEKGASLVLEGLDILDPFIAELVSELDKTMPCGLSNCEAFFSRPKNEAYGGHRDSDDVLVIQISGKKHWRVHEPQQRRYHGNSPLIDAQMGPVTAEFDMSPGDVMFLKAGVPHKCTTVVEHSLHLSFDLIDRTLNIEQIGQIANNFYNKGTAEAHSPVVDVIGKYVDYMKSTELRSEVEAAQKQMGQDVRRFRERAFAATNSTVLLKNTKHGT